MKNFLLVFLLLFLFNCSSNQIVPEPALEQITVKSESICLNVHWYNPVSWFCYEARPFSLSFRGVIDNSTGKSTYYLDYHIDPFDKDLPVGVSLKLDTSYYNLPKTGMDYLDSIKIISQMSDEVLQKASKSKNIGFSYSNRSETVNLELSSSDADKLRSALEKLSSAVSSQAKMVIVK